MGAQFYGAYSFFIEEMFEDIKSKVPIDELSTQERAITRKKRTKKLGNFNIRKGVRIFDLN